MLRALTRWSIDDPVVEPSDSQGCSGAMVWRVREGGRCYFAKLVTSDQQAFMTGLGVAEQLAAAGFGSGTPHRTVDGELTVSIDGGQLAVLAEVPGRPARPDSPTDRAAMGGILAAAHNGLREISVRLPEPKRWPWRPDGGTPSAAEPPPELSRAVKSAIDVAAATGGRLTHGLTHGDPKPLHFRIGDASAPGGLIDWGSVSYGPLLYDLVILRFLLLVGSAIAGRPVVAADFDDVLAGYLPDAPVGEAELAYLPLLNRMYAAFLATLAWSALRAGSGLPSAPAGPAEAALRVACEQLGVGVPLPGERT